MAPHADKAESLHIEKATASHMPQGPSEVSSAGKLTDGLVERAAKRFRGLVRVDIVLWI